MLALFKRWEVCVCGLMVLTSALFIPLVNFVMFNSFLHTWRQRVHSAKVSKGKKTSKDAAVLVRADRVSDITKTLAKEKRQGGDAAPRARRTSITQQLVRQFSFKKGLARSEGPLFVWKDSKRMTSEREGILSPKEEEQKDATARRLTG